MPVGTRDMLEAAIQNGADAVYYGVPHWNARGRTEDFSFEDVAEMIRYARIRSVRTFLAMNILVFEREIRDLPEFLEKLISWHCYIMRRSLTKNKNQIVVFWIVHKCKTIVQIVNRTL